MNILKTKIGKHAMTVFMTPLAVLAFVSFVPLTSFAAPPLNENDAESAGELPYYLKDRGTGVATSMFGTYAEKGDIIVYPFVEYYINKDEEYSPEDFGYADDEDYRGRYEAFEYLIFIGYGLADDIAFEFEASWIDATLERDDDDPSGASDEINEAGIGDVEGQIRWRFMGETGQRPEMYALMEIVAPVHKDKKIIGTPDWEFAWGVAVTKGFGWGTLTLKTSVEYTLEDDILEAGEYAVEYLKKFSPAWRGYLAIEGEDDEIECIPELQWHIKPDLIIKFNSAFGVTDKAKDWAPEFGVMFYF